MKKQRIYGVISLKLFVVMRRKAKLFVRIADKQEICERMPWKRTLCDDCYENYLQKNKAKK